jgi:hypothetical protein
MLIGVPNLWVGLNVHEGCSTHPAVAEGLSMPYVPPDRALGTVTSRGPRRGSARH